MIAEVAADEPDLARTPCDLTEHAPRRRRVPHPLGTSPIPVPKSPVIGPNPA